MKKIFCLLLLITASAHAEDAAAILARSDAYRASMESFSIDIELTNHEDARTETSKIRVYGRGSDRSVVEFLAPATDKGKYLLMLRDAMWIYLPSASRPIRISPLQRLMGQASNGDVARTSFTVDYIAKSATAETIEGRRTWSLQLDAKDPGLAYKRVQLWTDAATGEPIRADFYAVSGKLLKRAHYRKFAVMGGRRMVSEIEIEDMLRAGRRTVMSYSALTPRENPEKMFTRDALGKW
jgi:outer membrane lipoprotein-sorting protein